MHHNEHLQFLQQKIAELESAIFFNLSEAVLKFPTSLIHNPVTDDFGFIWTWVRRPKQNITEFENGFPVRLDFYRKGATSFLKLSGTAWIVTDPEEQHAMLAAGNSAGFAPQDMVLVKVKMQCAEYHETATGHKQSWWSNKAAALSSFFRQPQNGYATSNTYFPAS